MNYLSDILATKAVEIQNLPQYPIVPDCQRDFTSLTKRQIVIAEIKASSPSHGQITSNFNPLSQAQKYCDGGTTAISVLTDETGFGGSFEILRSIRAITDKPLLCKDFIIDEKQIRHARMNGADIILLIVKALTPEKIYDLKGCVEGLGMKALIEIQNEEELDIAKSIDAGLILLNTRDLVTFIEDHGSAIQLAEKVPDTMTLIYASGIQSPEFVSQLPHNIDGCLIGTALMQSENPERFIQRTRALLPK